MKSLSRVLAGVLAAIYMVTPALAADIQTAGSTGTAIVPATVTATTMSVTVPMQLPVTVDAEGVATYATNAVIQNKSFGPVVVKDASITGQNGWTVVSFDTDMAKEAAGTKKLAFKLNGCETDGKSASIPGVYSALGIIAGGEQVALDYASTIPAQTTAIDNTTAAKVVFTVDWYKGSEGSLVPDNSEGGGDVEPTYTVGETYPISFKFEGVPEGQDTVTWASSDESVATIAESPVATMSLVSGIKSAVVTIVGPGSCDITATLGNGYKQSMAITATPAIPEVTGIKITGTSSLIERGAYRLDVESTSDEAALDPNEVITAVSSNKGIVAVNSVSKNYIYIDAVSPGKATITATYKNLTATIEVSVVGEYVRMKDWETGATTDFHAPDYASKITQVKLLEVYEELPSGTEFDISEAGDGSVKAVLNGDTLHIKAASKLANIGNYMLDGTATEDIIINSDFAGTVDGRAFVGSPLRNIDVGLSSYGGAYTSYSGALLTKDKSTLVAYPSGRNETTVHIDSIDKSITKIGNYALCNNPELWAIYFGDSVVSIGDYAVYNNPKLQEAHLGDSVVSIGAHAFEQVPVDSGNGYPPMLGNLYDVTFGPNVATIGAQAFKCTRIYQITLPKSVTNIDTTAFEGCNSLSTIYLTTGATSVGAPWGAPNASIVFK